jgi:hypothetical protein
VMMKSSNHSSKHAATKCGLYWKHPINSVQSANDI